MKKLIFLFSLLFFLPFYFVDGAQETKQEIVEFLIPKLNSDRITYFFGNYGVESIEITASPFGESRVSNLYSINDNHKIMRTLAIVEFKQPIPEALEGVHKEICQGKSVGIALRQNGWMIDKMPLYFGSVFLSPQLRAWMQEETCDKAAVHIYKLNVFKEGSEKRLEYCSIIEVHSPQYLDENWLQQLYSNQYKNFQESSSEVSVLLDSLNSLINAFPYP